MGNAAPTYTVSDYILDRLKSLGLKHMFVVPGDYASFFLDTLDSDPDIERIANINELGVGYAADGYGRFKGIAACSVQYGVGAFSILNCIAGAYVERVPMALIGPSPSTKNRITTKTQGVLFHHSTGDLEADQKVMENVTVASIVVRDGASAPAQIDNALIAMITHRRPVYIEVLQDIFGAGCTCPIGVLKAEKQVSESKSLAAAVDAAWTLLEKAKLPLIWWGVEIQRYGLQALAQEMVDVSGIMFTTTSLGKTVLDESQKQFVGTYAGPASPALTRAVVAATDCVLALGTIITDDYLDIMNADYGKMILSTDEGTRVGYSEFQFVAMEDFIAALLQRMRDSGKYPKRFAKPAYEASKTSRPLAVEGLTYDRFYSVMGEWLIGKGNIADAKLILGESTSLYVFGNLMGMPPDSFVAQAAWGSLGHETGCALGIELATGQRPIVVAGDGGFMMICQEISSLVRQKSDAIVFVMSNGGYAIEQSFVDINAFTPQGEYAPFDILPEWDYLALAKAFGAKGYVVETVGQLRRLLQKLETKTGVPALVQVKIPLKDLPLQLCRLATPQPSLQDSGNCSVSEK
ncbi:MAG: alpha-keto acid decarboxylase family protein [Bacteroidetes bacterium]|nr:alpha-keto acid decarboxylase family protein [Bacteroidota bacterium]